MTAEISACAGDAFVHLDLLDARIAFDVENAVALEQVVVELLRSANIQDRIRVPVELADLLD